MFHRIPGRLRHHLVLLAAAGVLFFPNLGVPSLWDIDEGNNMECTREMLDAGNYVIPQFNYKLRVDKPALLYWLQMAAARAVGVNELAARLPSALAATLTLLAVYELGRRLFDAATGLLAGVVLAGTALFCGSAHFANPDAVLNLLTVVVMFLFWDGYSRGSRGWLVTTGVVTGLAVLAKGPVGLVLPSAVTVLFLAWSKRLGLLRDRRLLWGALAFTLVAVPWYALVGAETKANFLKGFLGTHNVGRFVSPMEGHRGPFYYHVLSLAVGFAPWSVFLGLIAWAATGARAAADGEGPGYPPAYRLLICWFLVYFVFFSAAATKLPNYLLPAYPPLALLTARFLERWRRGLLDLPGWAMPTGLTLLGGIGLGVGLGLLIAGGVIDVAAARRYRLSDMAPWAALGIIPLGGAVTGFWCLCRSGRTGVVASVAASAVAFLGLVAAGACVTLDAYKAPRPLVAALDRAAPEREHFLGTYQYFQPSLVFYARRQVRRMAREEELLEFLQYPVPVYVFVPAPVWDEVQPRASVPCRVLARHHDLYQGRAVVLVTNR